jgi:hypothetical protein
MYHGVYSTSESNSSPFPSFEKHVDELPVPCFDEPDGCMIGRREESIL